MGLAPEAEPPRGDAMKFTYPSGSKPLEGYTLKRGIGRGGFGEVYYAVSDAGKEVALKLIKRHLDVELRGVRHCLNLKHPNLLALHDIRTDAEDDRWVIMEYIAGESLEDAIERHPNGLPLDEALDWMHGVAAGVAYLHEHGIVHRDLKPGNIFRDEGIVKIGDYGLSKFVSCSRRSGQTESVGTVHYMAPEIANGRYGKEIDTYALGILLYEVLTGRVPFEGESVGEVLMKHLTAEPDLTALNEPYRALIGRALAKDPAQRLASVKELIAQLPRPNESNAAHAHLGTAPSANYTAEEVVTAELVSDEEEPIWKAVRASVKQINDQWTAANFHPLVKVAVLLGGGFLLLSSAGVWFPLLFFGVMVYGVYWVIRALVQQTPPSSPPQVVRAAPPPVAPIPTAPPPPVSPARRVKSWRADARPVRSKPLAPKSPRQKLTELTGSMLLAAGVALIMTIVMMVLRRGDVDAMRLEQFVWLAMTGVLGAWAVMIPAKLWEGGGDEVALRRFTMLVVGLLLGVLAFGLARFLTVDLPFEVAFDLPVQHHEAFYEVDGAPKLAAYLGYFGFLMLLLRWWRQADPYRATRLSLWATTSCLFAAWLLNFVWPFPQPWGFMLTGIMAITVQLASPWQPREKL